MKILIGRGWELSVMLFIINNSLLNKSIISRACYESPSLWPSGIGSRLGRNRSWVRFLAVSDIYPMFIEPTITWVPSGFSGYIWLDTKIVFLKKTIDSNLKLFGRQDEDDDASSGCESHEGRRVRSVQLLRSVRRQHPIVDSLALYLRHKRRESAQWDGKNHAR